jgi:hypothetical protein
MSKHQQTGAGCYSVWNCGRLGDWKGFGVGLRNGDCRMERVRGN